MADELGDLLREFEEVMEDFERGPACQYEQHLEELKKKAAHSVYDSGIDELESESRAGQGVDLGRMMPSGVGWFWELWGSSVVGHGTSCSFHL